MRCDGGWREAFSFAAPKSCDGRRDAPPHDITRTVTKHKTPMRRLKAAFVKSVEAEIVRARIIIRRRFLVLRLRLSFIKFFLFALCFRRAIRAMTAARVATISAREKKRFGKNHKCALPVKIFAFNRQRRRVLFRVLLHQKLNAAPARAVLRGVRNPFSKYSRSSRLSILPKNLSE